MDGFWNCLGKWFNKLGQEVVYQILVMFYCLFEPSVPAHVKATIVGALSYFIAPIDLIPDIAPIVGLSDDITAIASAYAMAQIYATPEVREKAQNKVDEIFRNNKVVAEQEYKED